MKHVFLSVFALSALFVLTTCEDNNNTPGTTTTPDTTAPTISMQNADATRQDTLADNKPQVVAITFSEVVTGFDADDITVTGATKGALSGTGKDYRLAVTVETAGTDVMVAIRAEAAEDAANNKTIDTSKTFKTAFLGSISTWQELQAISDKLDADYFLTTDITFPNPGEDGLPQEGFIPIGVDADDGSKIGDFTGTFDGQGHTIANLFIERSGSPATNVGIFSATNAADIQNFVVQVQRVQGKGTYTGAVIGRMTNGILTQVGVVGDTVSGIRVGGLVGQNGGGKVEGYSTVVVSGSASAGGLAGYNTSEGEVRGYSTGNVIGNAAGGLVGSIDDGLAVGYSTGDVSGQRLAGGVTAGGFASETSGTVLGYATGKLTLTGGVIVYYIGGLHSTVGGGAVNGYSRNNLYVLSTSANNRVGLLTASSASSVSGYHSSAAGESKIYSDLAGTTTYDGATGTGKADGTSVDITTVTSTNYQTVFSDLFSTTNTPYWQWVGDGKWPAIVINYSDGSTIKAPAKQPID